MPRRQERHRKFKERTVVSRREASEVLIRIGKELGEDGLITLGTDTVRVPDGVRLKIELEDGEFEVKLRWHEGFAPATIDSTSMQVSGNWVRAASKSELPPGRMKAVMVNRDEVLLANCGGRYHAVENRCPHKGGVLSEGRLEGDVIVCPRHEAKFDLRTGAVLSPPADVGLRVFEVMLEGEEVLIRAAG